MFITEIPDTVVPIRSGFVPRASASHHRVAGLFEGDVKASSNLRRSGAFTALQLSFPNS